MRLQSPTVDRALAEFIKIYHDNEPLWNTNNHHYTKSNIRSACYNLLVEKMRETQPYATKDDVLKKINIIRSCFRKEHRKVMCCAAEGKPYTPKLWYYKDLLFLNDCNSNPKASEEDQECHGNSENREKHNNAQLAKFIRIYRENEPLWNPQHKDYLRKDIRAAGYDLLLEVMQGMHPYATKDDVLRKINTIRSSFRKEYRKVLSHDSQGLSYSPRLWYYNDLTFLINLDNKKQTAETAEDKMMSDNSEDGQQELEAECEDALIEYNQAEEEESDQGAYARQETRAEETVQRRTYKRQNESHAVIFGKHVAAKLEMVSGDQRIFLEKLINDAIFEAELGNLGRDCKIMLE